MDVTRQLLDEVTATHPPLVITQRGRPAARVVPIDDGTAQCLFGYMKGPSESLGDIVQMPQEPRATEMGEEDAPAARLLVATARSGVMTQ